MEKKLLLTEKEVRHVARLANLNLKPAELKKFQKQLSSIVDFVSELNQVDATGIEPTSQVTGLENVLREDKITPSLTQKEVLSNAPARHKGYFKVKAVFEV